MPRTTIAAAVTAAKTLVQDTNALLLLKAEGDFTSLVADAAKLFSRDIPNRRVYDYTVTAQAFRFLLHKGTSADTAVLPDSGADAWVEGDSYLAEVWEPYDAAEQYAEPEDGNNWRVVHGPADRVFLEFLDRQVQVASVLRLVYHVPHQVAADAADTTIKEGHTTGFTWLLAALILQAAANKATQNTGNTGLPNEVVDRRSQAGEFMSRSKAAMDRYRTLLGIGGTAADITPASGMKDLDVGTQHVRGSLWHPASRR